MTVNFGRCVMRLDEGDLSSDALGEVRDYKRKIDRRLRSFIQEGIEDGSITRCDPKIAAFSIAGALNWICMWYEPGAASAGGDRHTICTNADAGPGGQKRRERRIVSRRSNRMIAEPAIETGCGGVRFGQTAHLPSSAKRRCSAPAPWARASPRTWPMPDCRWCCWTFPPRRAARSAIAAAGTRRPEEEQARGVLRPIARGAHHGRQFRRRSGRCWRTAIG